MAWMPKSPKASSVPPLAAPVRLGWCCLRCLTLRGINMAQASPVVVSVGTAAPVVVAGGGGAGGRGGRRGGRLGGRVAGGAVGAARAGRALGAGAAGRTLTGAGWAATT